MEVPERARVPGTNTAVLGLGILELLAKGSLRFRAQDCVVLGQGAIMNATTFRL